VVEELRLVLADEGAAVVLLLRVTSDVAAPLKEDSADDVGSEMLKELLGSAVGDELGPTDVMDWELKVTVGTDDDSEEESLLISDEMLPLLESKADEVTETVELSSLETEDDEIVS
jgi:hypothetical protein